MKGRKVVLMVEDMPVQVTFKKIKKLRLTVRSASAEVRVSAPVRVSLAAVKTFISTHIDWIHRHRSEILSRPVTSKLPYQTGDRLFIWGEEVTVQVVDTLKRPSVSLKGHVLTLNVPPESSREEMDGVLDKWLKREVNQATRSFIDKWETRMNVRVDRFSIRKMTTRWGSCTPKTRSIRFNSELGRHAPECLEYVVVHELAHLIERSHNARFKAILDRFMPDWREIQGLLNPPSSKRRID